MDVGQIKDLPLEMGQLGTNVYRLPATGSYVTYKGDWYLIVTMSVAETQSGTVHINAGLRPVNDEGEPTDTKLTIVSGDDISDITVE